MTIQIFGKSKCFDTKKAERFFKERGVRFQSVDLPRYGMSRGELTKVKNALGLEAMLDPKAKDYPLVKYLAGEEAKVEKRRKRETPVVHRGKQTVKQLTRQNQGVSNIDIQDKEIRQFERIARKYGVDYAVKKDRSTSPPKYMIFFKGRDADAITAAFQEYMGRKLRRETRPSVLERLEQYKDMARNTVEKVRKKVLER